MIYGHFDAHGRPVVKGLVFIPRLVWSAHVDFLWDTGADRSSLFPRDGIKNELPYDALLPGDSVMGIGGVSEHFKERARVVFMDSSGRRYVYNIDIDIMPKENAGTHFLSLLGRDIASQWKITYDPLNVREHLRLRISVATADGEILSSEK